MKGKLEWMRNTGTKKVRMSIIIITLFFGLVILGISYSYALFTISVEKQNVIALTAGSISYTLTSESMNEQKEVSVGAHSMLTFTVNLESNNEIDSLYQLYYSGSIPNGVTISYKTSVADGTIEKGAIEVIVLVIENTSSSNQTVTIGVQGGLLGKPLILEENATAIQEVYQLKNPIITINNTEVIIDAGDHYSLMTGVSAKDAYGKDISGKIEVYQERCSGDSLPCYPDRNITWDNHTIGTTKFYYQVSDDYGGFQEVTRTITVNRVYIYNYGETYDAFTGGWGRLVTTADAPGFFNGGYLAFNNSGAYHNTIIHGGGTRTVNSFGTQKALDVSKYKYLRMLYKASYTTEEKQDIDTRFGCYDGVTNFDHTNALVADRLQIVDEKENATVMTLELTGIDACHVMTWGWGLNWVDATVYPKLQLFVYQIWFE